jgi:hypothetical protein
MLSLRVRLFLVFDSPSTFFLLSPPRLLEPEQEVIIISTYACTHLHLPPLICIQVAVLWERSGVILGGVCVCACVCACVCLGGSAVQPFRVSVKIKALPELLADTEPCVVLFSLNIYHTPSMTAGNLDLGQHVFMQNVLKKTRSCCHSHLWQRVNG